MFQRKHISYVILLMALFFLSRAIPSSQADEVGIALPPEQPRTVSMEKFLQDRTKTGGAFQEAVAATACIGGIADTGSVQYPCNNVDLLAFMPLGTIGGGEGNDIWGWTDPLDNKEYALMGRTNGTAFIDVTDPENPIYLGNLPGHNGSTSTWRDIKTYANHAFIVSEASGHGMQIFDLTQLRSVASPPAAFVETAHFGGFGNSHNIVINEDTGFAYSVGGSPCSGGLQMINISNPTSPTDAGCFSSDGYTHDAQCVVYQGPDVTYQGSEICFNNNEDTLTVVDVSDKTNPVQLSRVPYSGDAYTHQGWLTEDHAYFLLGDELDEQGQGHNTRTRIFDTSDLDDVTLVGFHDGSTPAIDHNIYVVGDNAYQSNYTAGLQILELSDVANGNLTEVAYFDTYVASNSASFNGTWSNYPFFDSGIVIVSGIGEGMFILQPHLSPDYVLTSADDVLNVCGDATANTTVDLTARNGYVGTVNLSTVGLPGTVASVFTPNPVVVPNNSVLGVTTAGTNAGIYPFTILSSDGTLSHTVDITLNVFDATPTAPTLQTPANSAIDIPLLPTLAWQAVAQQSSYIVEVATDNGFSNIVYSGTTGNTSHTLISALTTETTYYWRVRGTNSCGTGSNSATFSFTTAAVPSILLIDDDDNSPDVRPAYETTLGNLGLSYDVWDTNNSDNEPTAAELAPYEMVIWFTGDEFGGAAGPGSTGEAALSSWLDNGKCLFLSSQDYYYDRNTTPFMQNYLGMATSDNDSGDYSSVNGQGIYASLGNMPLSYGSLSNYSDDMSANGTASLGLVGNNSNGAALVKDTTYRTTWWAFPFSALGNADRDAAMQATFNWCNGAPLPTVTPTSTPPPTTPTSTPLPPTPTSTPLPPTPTPTPAMTPEPGVGYELYFTIIKR